MEATFLTENQIWGDGAMDVIKQYGKRVGATDLAIALGACMSRDQTTSDGLKTTAVWSASPYVNYVRVVDSYGDMLWN